MHLNLIKGRLFVFVVVVVVVVVFLFFFFCIKTEQSCKWALAQMPTKNTQLQNDMYVRGFDFPFVRRPAFINLQASTKQT